MSNNADQHREPRSRPVSRGSDGAFQGSSSDALPLTPSEDRQWATLAHFLGILGFVPSLIIFLIFRDRGQFTAQESKEAFNFTFPPSILAAISLLLSLLPVVGGIFAVLNAVIWVTLAAFSVAAGIHVNRGRPYRYPFNLRIFH
ncbi:hypothetical protein BJ994_001497 [Arthrobacter pigmenti]|uniref:DUF4870 domain-containing protein n=1 Tax=Arthrobacter pigmenti TaxID=271432 RepID=A0A846RVZ5_9MICC|nr:DUF4870 domain-containing protein [Arthrobacter pigmenti]NJC22421.1 hypothetical protein [Arthrobacter pigmenti]